VVRREGRGTSSKPKAVKQKKLMKAKKKKGRRGKSMERPGREKGTRGPVGVRTPGLTS